MNKNLYALFKEHITDFPDQIFLHLPDGQTWSYSMMDTLSGQFAAALRQRKIGIGDRVMAQVVKSPATIALYLACLRIGAIYIPLNTSYTRTEVDYFLLNAQPQLFIYSPENDEENRPTDKHVNVEQVVVLTNTANDGLWAEARMMEGLDEIAHRDADDVAAMIYTSGTTGQSKGAMITHNNLSSNALALTQLWGFTHNDVLLHALPVYHIHGLFVALHCAILSASKVLFLPGFDLNAVRAALKESTVMMGVPTFYTRLLSCPDFSADECKNIRVFISGSAPLTETTFKEFENRTGHCILERYGMSEAGMITSNPLQGDRIAGTVGYALPDVEVRITDDEGNTLPDGQTGHVEVSGTNVFKGYWGMQERTLKEFKEDGFFITGDLGKLVNGRLSLVGRTKDLIISGGMNIYPKEIESVLDDLDGITESAVIGVPHPDYGEAIIAVIVSEPESTLNPEKIRNSIKPKLANYKQPKKIFFVSKLPRNTMGKLQKNKLRKKYQSIFSG